MLGRLLSLGLLLLLTVQYATLGGAFECGRNHDPEPTAAEAPHHEMPADTGPCPGKAPTGSSHHSSRDCMAMTGCNIITLRPAAVLLVAALAPVWSTSTQPDVALRSVAIPPDTPPPIA